LPNPPAEFKLAGPIGLGFMLGDESDVDEIGVADTPYDPQ
jgi:hypothetical protein